MSYGWNTDSSKSRRERDLEYDLEQERDKRRRQEERYQREIDERQAEIRERINESYRQAQTWPEALRNQMVLLSREIMPDDPANEYFTTARAACKRALELWPDAFAKVSGEIAALEKRIMELRANVALQVADELEAEGKAEGWTSVAGAIRTVEENPEELGNWLYW